MSEFFIGFAILCGYFLLCALIAIICRKTLKIPDEVFRKILHFILLGSVFTFTFAFKTWWISALAAVIFMLIVYPILLVAEKFKNYSKTVTERKKGELKSSLLIVFSTFAVVIAIAWGLFGSEIIVLSSILSWGIGDALAALIGTKFGKRKIYEKKTLEGSLTMLCTSFLTLIIIFSIANLTTWYFSLLTSLIVAVAVSAAELYTPNGLDTLTCPLTSLFLTVGLLSLFGALA